MIRRSAIILALAASACTPSVPDSGAGVGFQDYDSYIRNSYPAAPPPAPATVIPSATPPSAPPATAGFDPAAASAAIDRADGRPAPTPAPVFTGGNPGAPLDATALATPAPAPAPAVEGIRPRGGAPAGIKEESGEVANINPGISDEQDFEAVKARESIESDAERIARNRAQYVVVQPRDLPQRPGDSGPNIVEFALATTHAPGTQLYARGGLFRKDQNATCAKFASPDLAQAEFLAKGGPDRDRLGVDPDGDGFACDWDPRPFRTALQ